MVDIPSIPATTTPHGVTTNRPAEAAQALVRLMEDASLRRRLGRAGQNWVCGHLSAASMAERTYQLYQRLMGC
jgi:glycosyltransferase involved in cell wall biosynthesis